MRAEKSYGVRERMAEPADNFDIAVEALEYQGFVVIPDVLPSDKVGEFNARLDSVYARQCTEVGGEEKLMAISDADIVRCPLAYDESFLELALNPTIIEVAKRAIGPSILLLMQNGVINRPERVQVQTSWHRDLNYQHWVCSRPLAISAMVCLEDFNEETGGTVCLAGSHKVEAMPSDAALRTLRQTPSAPAGSIVFFDAMTFHRSGINRSGRIRRGINHVIGAPILAQAVDIPKMRGDAPPPEPFLAGYLGYRWNPAPSVVEWRRKKIEANPA